jgi:hypothetical protein
VVGERLGHERGVDALAQRDLLHHVPEGHDVVGGRERVGVAQVDLLLPRRALVVAELDRDPHVLEHRDRVPAEVVADAVRDVVEEAALVHRRRGPPVAGLVRNRKNSISGCGVEGEPEVRGLGQGRLSTCAGRRTTAGRPAARCRRTSGPCPATRTARAGSGTVPGSGRASMSDSATRAKPSMAEPSKPMPSSKAPSSSAGATATDLRKPSTSVNQSRTKRMSRSSRVRSTNSCCLSMPVIVPRRCFALVTGGTGVVRHGVGTGR